jgi:hypothetical protein
MQLVDKYRLSATFLQGGELELFKDGVCSSGHNYMVTSVVSPVCSSLAKQFQSQIAFE